MASDRERLKGIHATDLTESNVNEEFVDWLKTTGMLYLLGALVVIVGYLFWNNYKGQKANYEAQAFAEYSAAYLPVALNDIASEYADVAEIQKLARLKAARNGLRAIRSGVQVTAITALQTAPETISAADLLTPEDREKLLSNAESAFVAVLDDEGSEESAHVLYAVGALNGRAMVAESRGDLEEAKRLYELAAERAGTDFPSLAANARLLAETAVEYGETVEFPSAAEIDALRISYQPERLLPPAANPALDAIIDPNKDLTESE